MTVWQRGVGLDDADTYVRTRRGLHGVAEILIAGPQHRRHGTIRLAVDARGFCGAVLPIAVEGTDLVWPHGRATLAGPVAELAAAAGVDVGAPDGVYQSAAPLPVDRMLDLDPQQVARVHHSLHLGAQALKAFAPDQQPVLWPEHFDVSVTVGAVNYGLSAGDSHHRWPYAYVGPPTAQSGAFWNAPFGALRALEPGNDVAAVLGFFNQGKEHLS
jgi:hypothetical protein